MKRILTLLCCCMLTVTNISTVKAETTEETGGGETNPTEVVEEEEEELLQEETTTDEVENTTLEEQTEVVEDNNEEETNYISVASLEDDISTTSTDEEEIHYLDKTQLRMILEDVLSSTTNAKLYVGSKSDYPSASSYVLKGTINDYYSVYTNDDNSNLNVYVIGKDTVYFPEDCTEFFAVTNNSNYKNIKNIEFGSINAESISNTTSMFSKLKLDDILDLSGFNTINLTNMSSMFELYEGTTINLNGFNISNAYSMEAMFRNTVLTGFLDLSGFTPIRTAGTNSVYEMFEGAEVKELKMFDIDSYCINYNMFSNAKIGSDLDLSSIYGSCNIIDGLEVDGKLTLSKGGSDSNAFHLNNLSVNGDLIIPLDSKDVNAVSLNNVKIKGDLDLSEIDASKFENVKFWFCNITGELVLKGWDISSLKDATGMFMGTKIGKLDLSTLDFSRCKNMSSMFMDAEINDLNLTSIDTSNVTDMSYMFFDCKTSVLDLTNFNTSKVTTMLDMFYGDSLTTIYVSDKFITKNISDNEDIFNYCSNLVGGNGTRYGLIRSSDWENVGTKKYAVIDTPSTKGYFTSKEKQSITIDFIDVNASTPHVENITWLANNGISKGWNDGTFRPLDKVARADMAAFLRRLAQKYGVMDADSYTADELYWQHFSDVDQSSPHATDILWLYSQGISTGWEETGYYTEDYYSYTYTYYTFRPYDTVARCDMAAFLRRMAESLNISDASTWTPTEEDWNTFSDINKDSPHAEDVLWLAHVGISQGWTESDGSKTFRPLDKVARCDMAAFLERMMFCN